MYLLKGGVMSRVKIFHFLFYSPNVHNSWMRLKPGARSSIWVSHLGGRFHTSLLFPVAYSESKTG